MGPILHILLALGALAIGELGWDAPLRLPWLVPALAVAPYALASASRRLFLRGRFRTGAVLERLLLASPVASHLVCIVLLGWLASVEQWCGVPPGLSSWPGFELFLALVPFLLFELCAIDAHARLMDSRSEAVRHVRSFQLRLFLAAALPFGIYLAVSGVIGLREELRVSIEEIGVYHALFSVGLIGFFVLALPALLSRTWDTAPIEPGATRSLLESVARAAGFRARELLVWRTGNHMANAAIVGFSPRSRVVLFSDALLANLGPRQLAAVFAHEIGHARRHHAAIFALFAVTFFVLAHLLFTWLDASDTWPTLAVLGGVLVAWYVSFGFLSRRFELEADLVSLELLGESEPLVQALEEVSGAHAHARASWRHFSTRDRVEFLRRAERDPGVGQRLRRVLRAWTVLGAALFVLAVGWQAVDLARGYDEDRLVADLRLGRYEAARERFVSTVEPDEELERLIDLGAGLPETERSGEALEARALTTVARGDYERGLALLELSRLRGRRALDPVIEAVQASAEGEPATTLAGSLSAAWRAALRAAAAPANGRRARGQ